MDNSGQKYSFLKSYIKGEAQFGFWNIAVKLLTAANAFFIISYLDIYKYGVYLLILAFYSLTANFFLRPLYKVVFNDISLFISQKKDDYAKKLYLEISSIRIFFGFFLFLALFFGAKIVAGYYDYDIANLFRILSFLFIIDACYTSMRMLFRARLYFGIISVRSVVYKVLKLFFIVLYISLFNFGIKEAIISHVAASFFATIIFIPVFLKAYNPWKKIKSVSDAILIKIVKTYGKWSLFGQFISKAVADIRPWLIKFFVSTEAVAIYSVAESLYGAVKAFFPIATLSALIPRELSDIKRKADILLRGTKYLAVFGLLLGLISFFVLPPIIEIIFPQYIESIGLFKLLLILLPIFSFRSMSSSFLTALRRQKFLFFVGMIEIVGTLTLSMILLYLFGIFGMVIYRIAITIIIGGIMYIYLLKKETPPSSWKRLFIFDSKDRIFIKKLWSSLKKYLNKKLSPGI